MKNKKMILIFSLIVVLLAVMVPYVQAEDVENLPVIDPENNIENATGNATDNQTTNNEVTNNDIEPVTNNATGNTNVDTNAAGNTLPQTGVAENSTLLIFVAICTVSAIYAYTKIKNYKNI